MSRGRSMRCPQRKPFSDGKAMSAEDSGRYSTNEPNKTFVMTMRSLH